MAVEGIWCGNASDFYAHGDSASWSVDINIPEQTAYASAALSQYDNSQVGYPFGYAFCGVLFYVVVEKRAYGTVFVNRVPSRGFTDEPFVPAIMDNNVVMVSFGYGANNSNADCRFQIMGFGQ